jgi:hypothetical protein
MAPKNGEVMPWNLSGLKRGKPEKPRGISPDAADTLIQNPRDLLNDSNPGIRKAAQRAVELADRVKKGK